MVRFPAELIAVLSTSYIVVEKFDSFTLDASSSYDSEEGVSLNYTYIWDCPNDLEYCNSVDSAQITIDPLERGRANLNGTNYTYSVVMSDGIRNS